DEDDRRVTACVQIGVQAFAPEARAAVLVEGLAGAGRGELVYQRSQRTTSSSGFHGNFLREPAFGPAPSWPTVTTPTISRSPGIPRSSRSRSFSSPTSPKSPAPSPSS